MIVAAVYDLLFLIPLSVAAASFTLRYSGSSSMLWTIGAVLAAVYYVLLRHSDLRRRIIAAGITATVIAAVIFYHPKGARLEFMLSNIWIAKIICLVLCCALIEFFAKRYIYVNVALFAAGIVTMAVILMRSGTLEKTAVLAIWGFGAVTAADILQKRSHKEGDSDAQKHLVFISPFVIAVFLVLSFIKIPDRPYEWGFAKTISKAVKSTIAIAADSISGMSWESDSPVIGFSDRGKIGGNLSGFEYDVMDVKASKAPGDVVYLGGKVYEDFDGTRWSGSSDAYDDSGVFDTVATLSAVIEKCQSGSDVIPLSDAARDVSLTIECDNLASGQIFVPAKSFDMNASAGKSYHVSYYMLNKRSHITDELAAGNVSFTKEDWDEALKLCRADDKRYSFENYDKYRQEQFDDYLSEIKVSERMKKYMDELLEGCESDHEKLTRIAAMLAAYKYTETPGSLPENITDASEYLDYLIFDKREGYCSYFATAFVLLARAEGIPARYVQGYRCSAKDALHFTVRSTDAHAWPEAYIDGMGWVIFEPTPGLLQTTTSGWQTGQEKADKVFDIPIPEEAGETLENVPETGDKRAKINWRRIILPVAAGLVFTLLLFALDALLKKRRYKKLDERSKALWLCRRNMQILKRKGYTRGTGETLSEMKARLLPELGEALCGFIDTYETLLYSECEISEEERLRLESVCKALRKLSRKSFLHARFKHLG